MIATTDPATLPDLTTFTPCDQSADTGIPAGSGQRTDSSQPRGSGALVRAKNVGRAELQTGEVCLGLVGVPGQG